jgi:hypothetical protein
MTRVTRTVEVNDLTPVELAHLFTEMADYQQAEFFAQVWRDAKSWPGAGWCGQSLAIVNALDSDGRNAIGTLAAHSAEMASLREELACTLDELIDHNGDSLDDARATRVKELRA